VLSTFTGSYDYSIDDEVGPVTIALTESGLILRGMPEVWQDTPLRPLAENRFAVESLPFEVCFEPDAEGEIARFVVSGPELLGGLVPRYLQKRRS
jgi:hypothetical protein